MNAKNQPNVTINSYVKTGYLIDFWENKVKIKTKLVIYDQNWFI